MIDLTRLEKKTEETCHKESIMAVEKYLGYKIGIGLRINKKKTRRFFVALLVSLGINEDCTIDVNVLNKKVEALRQLDKLGYKLSYGGNGSVYCERMTKKADLEKNISKLQEVLPEYLGCELIDN